ncbi:MAG TPA: DUF5677 domain-containing protein [Acidothermaceae bacterium]|nr:DUF5677 domain-containing protein [Acidothermaceae bacterium]
MTGRDNEFKADASTRAVLLGEVLPALAALTDALPNVPPPGIDDNAYAYAHGFYCRVARTCEAALLLIDADLTSEATPLRRAALEHALALAWVIDEPAGAPAALLRAHQNRMKSIEKLIDGSWDVTSADFARLFDVEVQSTGQDHLVQYGQLIKRYKDGDDLLVAWLTETGDSHPSHTTASAYWRTGNLATTAAPKADSDVQVVTFIWWVAACQMSRLLDWNAKLTAIGEPAGLGIVQLPKGAPKSASTSDAPTRQ